MVRHVWIREFEPLADTDRLRSLGCSWISRVISSSPCFGAKCKGLHKDVFEPM